MDNVFFSKTKRVLITVLFWREKVSGKSGKQGTGYWAIGPWWLRVGSEAGDMEWD